MLYIITIVTSFLNDKIQKKKPVTVCLEDRYRAAAPGNRFLRVPGAVGRSCDSIIAIV